MQSLINQLLQLQELVLILEELKANGDGSQMDGVSADSEGSPKEKLSKDIDDMIAILPAETRSYVQRLVKKDKDSIIMAPMHNSACAICGMKLATSQVQDVRRAEHLQYCPSCARILYELQDVARWIGDTNNGRERGGARSTGIARFSAESLMVPYMKAKTRDEAILELANAMQDAHFIDDAGKLVTAAIEREKVFSTAMENGIAFPHVRGIEGGGLTLALGTSKNGFVYDDDGHKVDTVFLITIPTAVSRFYLRLVKGLASSLEKKGARKALLAANTKPLLWKSLIKITQDTVK